MWLDRWSSLSVSPDDRVTGTSPANQGVGPAPVASAIDRALDYRLLARFENLGSFLGASR